ncbi:MAG: hypothetical protein ABIH01_03235 [Candidatus Omnitrophota bacterium]
MKRSIVYFLVLAVLLAGCATGGKHHAKKVKIKKKMPRAVIYMDPKIKIARQGISRVFIGEFESRAVFKAAGIVFSNALRSVFMDRGFKLAKSKADADLFLQGEITRCGFRKAKMGVLKAVAGRLAYGKASQLYEVDMAVKLTLDTPTNSYQTQLSGVVKTHEQEMPLAVNDVSVDFAEEIVKTIK